MVSNLFLYGMLKKFIDSIGMFNIIMEIIGIVLYFLLCLYVYFIPIYVESFYRFSCVFLFVCNELFSVDIVFVSIVCNFYKELLV